ncbi:lysozyme inhibitor LprI family protein [Photobacterium sp. GB-27]|uniref:lysozyme inhibitor LprI family protein n=1 Tax=Photobacterium sp. GB-27 TaxID=2022109 RepID=UPI001E57F3B1|nr:lysozyme inhibitor LprI family protein [Photobacterium sp. GB-27]
MMKKRFYYPMVAAFILPTFFNTAFADYSKEFDQCIDTLGAYSPAVVKCMNEELSKRDKLLNTAYKQYMARIQDFRKEDLRKTQRLWIQYRDAKCGMFYHSESGSGGLEDLHDCLITETIQRTKELNEGW